MSIQTPVPLPNGIGRAAEAKERRDLASSTSFLRPSPTNQGFNPPTANNGEEAMFPASYSMNFSKGLPRDEYGNVIPSAYEAYVEAMNAEQALMSPGGSDRFEATVPVGPYGEKTAKLGSLQLGAHPKFYSTFQTSDTGAKKTPEVRTFESPRAGHAYDLEGPDADAVCMPPAPKVSSHEMAVEMAEVYAMALLRDVPFSKIEDASGTGAEGYKVADAAKDISDMEWFANAGTGTVPEGNRRTARGLERGKPKQNAKNLFRGAEVGAKLGPYISQFLLAGNGKDPKTGFIDYGAQQINQKVAIAPKGIDYMTAWHAWIDVQNGANVGGADPLDKSDRRYITTPRDLATYVHIDQLYQAYFNACLMMLGRVPFESGFPTGGSVPQEMDPSGVAPQTRGSFATFGGPHVLSLLTEVATRGLRAVRRQKFNYHRRCRPEMIGGMLTVAENTEHDDYNWDARGAFDTLLGRMPSKLLTHVNKRAKTLEKGKASLRVEAPDDPDWLTKNYLLPMAFPEGSPMHPAYGAGHATVAGACVTVLKAFFEMYDGTGTDEDDYALYSAHLNSTIYQANTTGSGLVDSKTKDRITLAGELDKLAANISIGRNMAGVHFYTDYYDSLRMGERIAVGIMQEQMTNYPEPVSMQFPSFDGDHVKIISRNGAQTPTVGLSGIALLPEVLVNGVNVDQTGDWWVCLR